MFLLFLAQAAAVPPAAPSSSRSKAIFSYDDYPVEAVINHWQGTVIADLTVSAEGKVSECRIVRSSGHKVLDDATCDLIARRAKFIPAKDEHGVAKPSIVRSPPINWRLP